MTNGRLPSDRYFDLLLVHADRDSRLDETFPQVRGFSATSDTGFVCKRPADPRSAVRSPGLGPTMILVASEEGSAELRNVRCRHQHILNHPPTPHDVLPPYMPEEQFHQLQQAAEGQEQVVDIQRYTSSFSLQQASLSQHAWLQHLHESHCH